VEEARAQIEQTREEMSATIDAIQEKLDPRRLRRKAENRVQELTIGRAQHLLDEAGEKAGVAAERSAVVLGQVGQVAQQTATVAGEVARPAAATAGQAARQASTALLRQIRRNPQAFAVAGATLLCVTIATFVSRGRGGAAAANDREVEIVVVAPPPDPLATDVVATAPAGPAAPIV